MKKIVLSLAVASSLFISNSFAGLVAEYNFDKDFTNSVNNIDENSKWEHSKDVNIQDGYLKLINNYDGDLKRNTTLTIDTSNYKSITVEKRSKIIKQGNYSLSGVGFYDGKNSLSLRYNYYHYSGTNETGQYDNREHFYINNIVKDDNNKLLSYDTSNLIDTRFNQWIKEKITVDFENDKMIYEIADDDGNNIEKLELNNIIFEENNTTKISFSAWDWANGSEQIIDYLKLSTQENNVKNQESIIYENENLTGISNAKLINDKVVVGFGELGTPKSGYPTEQNWYSLYMMNGSDKITIDDSTNAVNANELSISNIGNDIAVAYQKPTGSSYGFDSPFKIYTNGSFTTNEMIFTNANWGCCTSIDVDSQGYTDVIQFAHAGYFLNYSTNKSGSWVNKNISGYNTYYHYPKLTIDNNDIPHIITSQLNDNYGTKGVMQHWTNESGSWEKETIATDSNGHGKLIFDNDNNIYSTYVDSDDNLKLIFKDNSGNWSNEIIASGLDIKGRETRVAISNDNKIYVVAKNNDSDTVYLFTKNGTDWDKTILDDNLTPTTNDNSKAPSILFDTNNNPIIIYADDTKIYKYLFNSDSKTTPNICIQQITYAKNPKSGTWYPFNTSCDVPENWETSTIKPIDFNSTAIGLPPETTLDENTVNIFSAGFKAGKEYLLNNLNEFNTTITSTITNDKIDNLNTGWHLMGTSTPINNLDIFDNVKTIWKYNNGWRAYSPNVTIESLIENKSDIGILKNIEADEGFWINK